MSDISKISVGGVEYNVKDSYARANKENVSNKVTSISSSSTNAQYPSAKAVYDFIQSLDGSNIQFPLDED